MNYTFILSKTNEIIPSINGLPLHSTIDPIREAQKLLSTIPEDTGFIIFLGLGGGFAPKLALEQGIGKVIVIDYNITELLSSLKNNYSTLLNNPDFLLIKDSVSPENIKIQILKHYNPILHGGIKVIPLRTRIEQDKEMFESVAYAIQQAIESVKGDYSVQAHFGKRWFCNIIRNVTNMEKNIQNNNNHILNKKNKNAAIIAAGPSLDKQIDYIIKFKENNGILICSDTALGALLSNNIMPDIIVSIDCQYKSYYHFLGKKEIKNIPLVLDIASPPSLKDITSNPVFFASGHPLANYISTNWLEIPALDTSGGNVTFACFSLALSMSIENITFFGADFAYLSSQSYARGTYVMPYFDERQNRFKPLEAQSSIFMYRAPFLEHEPNQVYRETLQLKFYRECLEKKAGVKIAPGSGEAVQINLNQHQIKRIKPNKYKENGVEFLKDYKEKIINLSKNNDPDIITTLLPYAVFLKNRNPELKTKELLEETKKECIKEIDKIL